MDMKLIWNKASARLVTIVAAAGLLVMVVVNMGPGNVSDSTSEVVMEQQQGKSHDHFRKECGERKPTVYTGQGNEDQAVWEKFFSHPPTCNGTFVELGALDGEKYSNTLMFERDLGWKGILIEGSPKDFERLKKNRPNAILHHKAICPAGQKEVEFIDNEAVGGIKDEMPEAHIEKFNQGQKTVTVQCAGLGALVREAGFTHVDLLSLDVEGAELAVLNTLDWSIPVHVLVIEMNRHATQIRQLLTEKGYRPMLPEWNIREYCKAQCPANEVFVNVQWENQRAVKSRS